MQELKNVQFPNLDSGYFKILFLFLSFPNKEATLNEIVKELKISKSTANREILKLVKEGVLDKKEIGNAWRISLNKQHLYNRSRKVCFNLLMIQESFIVDIINRKYPSNNAIVLFGSYRKGDDNEESDIDLAVEVLGNKKLEVIELGVIKQFGLRFNVKVNLHLFSRNNININLLSNISNGIVIDGFLEVKNGG